MIIHPNVTTPKPSLLVKLILHLVNNHKNKDDNYNKLSSSISSKNLIKIILQWEQIRKSNKIKNFLLFHRKSLVRLIKIF